jgi:hypothetical protein
MFLASTLDVRRSALGVFFNHPKKVPPPTPDGREGRLFPPEQSSKSAQLLPELKRCRNKNFYKSYTIFHDPRESPNHGSKDVDLKGRSWRENLRTLAEACDARSSFVCAICVRKNRAASPDPSWSHIQTCSTQTSGELCFLSRRMIRTTARSG